MSENTAEVQQEVLVFVDATKDAMILREEVEKNGTERGIETIRTNIESVCTVIVLRIMSTLSDPSEMYTLSTTRGNRVHGILHDFAWLSEYVTSLDSTDDAVLFLDDIIKSVSRRLEEIITERYEWARLSVVSSERIQVTWDSWDMDKAHMEEIMRRMQVDSNVLLQAA